MRVYLLVILACSQFLIVDSKKGCKTCTGSVSTKITVEWKINVNCQECSNSGSWGVCSCQICRKECQKRSRGKICNCETCLKVCNYGLWMMRHGGGGTGEQSGGDGEERQVKDRHQCRPGDKYEGGWCVYPPKKGKKYCPPGEKYEGGWCVYSPKKEKKNCRPGDKYEGGWCVYPPKKGKKYCRPGEKYINGKCRYPARGNQPVEGEGGGGDGKDDDEGGGGGKNPGHGNKHCLPGDKYGGNGQCIYPAKKRKPYCRSGDKNKNGECRYPSSGTNVAFNEGGNGEDDDDGGNGGGGEKRPAHGSKRCRPGDKYEEGMCVYPSKKGKKHCRLRDKYIDGKCRYLAHENQPSDGGEGKKAPADGGEEKNIK